MRIYLDNQYPPGLVDVLTTLINLEPVPSVEIVYRDWNDTFSTNDTVVFFVNFNKKAVDNNIMEHYEEGFKVFVFRKPYGKNFSIYKQAVQFLTHWNNILKKIDSEPSSFIYSINGKQLKRIKIVHSS